MNPVVHFEMPAEDENRVVKFYEGVFGRQMQILGEDMGSYVLASTTETDNDGRPKNPGAINGGFFVKSPENSAPSVVISVDDVRSHARKVAGAGGKVLGEPTEIPGIGLYVSFVDPEGNRLSMLQPSR